MKIKKFRIKISSTWFSKDYIVFRYSTNGIYWKSVKCCRENIFNQWHYIKPKTTHFSNAKYLLQEFSTLEKVRQYEANERDKCKQCNKETTERIKRHKENRRNAFKYYL